LGVGPLPPGRDAADFVLGRFVKEEIPVVDEVVSRAAEAVTLWAREGMAVCMNRFNA
jgi:PTH1 family peptidyl-tRNA hydrolase